MADRTRIFIGIPAFAPVDGDILADFMRFAFHLGRRMPEYDFFIGVRKKAEQFRARNQIVDAATQVNADYVLMIDDDMLIDFNIESGVSAAYGFLEKLLAHNKDIIGVRYYQKTGECLPVAMVKTHDRGYRFLREDELTNGLQRVDVTGGGCLLVKMTVFDHLTFPYFGPEFEFGTDVQLCRQAIEKGFSCWIDSSIQFGHISTESTVITSRTRLQKQADSVPGEVRKHFVGREIYEDLLTDALEYTGYGSLDDLTGVAQDFLTQHESFKSQSHSDQEWYQQFPKQRIARQVWYNTLVAHKRTMTEAILNSVNHAESYDILDFGCGIGLPALEFARKGHRVTACDLQGTGTFEFLQWRAKKRDVALTCHESRGDIPHLGGARFEVIVAMDCLEHIASWRIALRELVEHLKPGGVLFCNNSILDDQTHPEHYASMNPQAFDVEAATLGLVRANDITFVKRPPRMDLETPQRVSLVGVGA